MDLRANINEPITLNPLERKLIPTGLYIALPEGYEAQIRPRSGLAIKNGSKIVRPTVVIVLILLAAKILSELLFPQFWS
jgi:dUTPase